MIDIKEMSSKKSFFWIIIFFMFSSLGCSSVAKNDSPDEKVVYSKEELEKAKENLSSEKKIDKFTFSAIYKPWDYIIAIENKGIISKAELEKKREEIFDLQYYTFKIKYNDDNVELLMAGLSSKDQYYGRIQYFSFEMQNDIKLIDGKDTLDCALFHFERTYGLASEATFSLGFPLTKEEEAEKRDNPEIMNKAKTLIYDDKALGIGRVYVTIEERKLNNIPEIKTQ